jgi:hypothetical protein
LPLPCKSAPGFLVNRVLVPYLYEAMFALQDGIPIETIDEAALRYGMPMGPVELADVVGLDVCKHVGDIVSAALSRQKPDTSRLDALIAAKKLGRKSGEGFYVWRDGKAEKSSAPRATPPADLEDRLILALANECAAVLRKRSWPMPISSMPVSFSARDLHPFAAVRSPMRAGVAWTPWWRGSRSSREPTARASLPTKDGRNCASVPEPRQGGVLASDACPTLVKSA